MDDFLAESLNTILPTQHNDELTDMVSSMTPMMHGDVSNVVVHTTTGDDPYHIMTLDHDGAKEVHVFKNMTDMGLVGGTKSAMPLLSTAISFVKPHLATGGTVRLLAHPDMKESYSKMLALHRDAKNYNITPLEGQIGPDWTEKSGWSITAKEPAKSRLNEFLEANRDILDGVLVEEVHPQIEAAAQGAYTPSRLANVSKTIRNLLKTGADTGLQDSKPKKGSSRAVYFPTEPANVTIDGTQTTIPHVMKVAFHGALDSHTPDKTEHGLLGESQNRHEVGASNDYATLKKNPDGSFRHNPEGFLPPLLSSSDKHEYISVGRVEPLKSGDFRSLTKNEEFPKGISHQEFFDAVNKHWQESNGQRHYSSISEEKLEHVSEHPLVNRAIDFSLGTDTHPGDFNKRNLGVWTHPVTGEKQIVASDAGFSRFVAQRYQNARKNQMRKQRGY
jgi:hypothetical protein